MIASPVCGQCGHALRVVDIGTSKLPVLRHECTNCDHVSAIVVIRDTTTKDDQRVSAQDRNPDHFVSFDFYSFGGLSPLL